MAAHRARIASLAFAWALASGSADAAIFTVNTTSDAADAAINGTCAAAMAPPNCTLRAAIMEANAVAGPHTINFAIAGAGPHTINVGAAGLPTIVTQQTIDGYSQPGSSANTVAVGSDAVLRIELNGTLTGAGVNGLTITAQATVQGLVVNRFAGYGILVNAGGGGSVLRGNFVGTNVAGTAASGNNRDNVGSEGGISLFTAPVTIGGTAPSARNLVSGNTLGCGRGIELWNSSGNTIQGNYVGTNATGTAAIANGCGGIVLDGGGTGSDNNLIGGALAGAGNLLSGNQVEGMFVQIGSDTNTIQGNIMGLDATGAVAIPNGAQGIKIFAAGNTVGGDTANERNLISGNTLSGIVVEGETADGNVIEGNFIGTDITGTLDRGNLTTGITVFNGADNTRIGGSALLGLGNLISGNSFEGIYVFDATTTGTIVQGNKIGTNAAGTGGIANNLAGFATDLSANGTRVGGINAGEGNLIAFNTFPGVGMADAATTATILGNSIHTNGQLGIDLGYDGLVTANDALDADAGPNDFLNFPVITGVYAAGASVDVSFSIDVPAGSYRVEFFTNPTGADPTGNGEGQVFAGFQNITHPGGGLQSFLGTISGSCADLITATASFCSDGAVCAAFSRTSEFSAVAASGCLAPGQPFVKSGSYTGNATAGRPIYVGFQPDVVFVKNTDPVIGPANNAVIGTSTMAGNAKSVTNFPSLALAPNLIQSLDPTGFTVGSAVDVNEAGVVHHWVAFKAAPGLLKVGTYPGDGNDNRSVSGIGFQPEFVITLPADAGVPVNAMSTAPADTTFDFDATQVGPNLIQAFQPDGFEVGNHVDVNTNGVTYHYIAWNAVPGRMAVGSYFGNGLDNRNLDLAGFFPEWVIVKKFPNGSLERAAMHKPASTGTGTDIGLRFSDVSSIANTLQTLRPLGFQVGNDTDRINSATDCGGPCTYHWVAFGPHVPQANYRSIGTAGPHSAGTITATVGSPIVTGALSGWRTANRGRGDSITFGAFTGTILSVDSETQLTLTSPSTVGGSPAYTISRKFMTLTAWEDCIDGGGTSCGPDAAVPSASLVADNRNEVGIAYKDSIFTAGANVNVLIDGSTTDALHTITLTADPGNRHNGIAGTGVILDGGSATDTGVLVYDDFVTVEWLEVRNGGSGFDGVEWQNIAVVNQGVARNLLIHGLPDNGIQFNDSSSIVDVYDNIVYQNGGGIRNVSALGTGSLRIFNNTVYNNGSAGGISANVAAPFLITLRNNISHSNGGANGDYNVATPNAASSHNFASDLTGTTHSPAGGGQNSVPLSGAGGINFVSTILLSENLHLLGTSQAVNAGVDLSAVFQTDIDGVVRLLPWEVGADDTSQTTAVSLQSFSAAAQDAAVDLAWSTASELQNLGFHLYRSASSDGPWTRISPSLIPGLGSSPTGASYAWRDSGLENGTTYHYLLEDVETTGLTQRHGPVSATPQWGSSSGGGGGADGSEDVASDADGRIDYGNPGGSGLRVVERGPAHVVLELLTPGFTTVPSGDGLVRVFVPGFEEVAAPGTLAVPVRHALVEALAGRKVRLASVHPDDVVTYDGFRLAAAGAPEVVVTQGGIVRPGVSGRRLLESHRRSGFAPRLWARLLGSVFQGETKKARLELAPLRHDPLSGRTVLARRLTVRLEFAGADGRERSLGGSRGRRAPEGPRRQNGTLAQLVARAPGLYRLRFEDVFAAGQRSLPARSLRLSRRGQAVAYHLEPDRPLFGPGSSLFFLSDGQDPDPRGQSVFELSTAQSPSPMEARSGGPSGPDTTEHVHTLKLEQNKLYQAGLLQASDLWLWEVLVSPVTKSYPFTVTSLSPTSAMAHLRVVLQGASDFEALDHHLRLSVNGIPVAEATWDGTVEQIVEADLTAGVLVEGLNSLSLENVGDAGAAYSMVFLNRFEVRYPRLLTASGGRLEGRFDVSGRAEVLGLDGTTPTFVLDTTAAPVWLTSLEPTPAGVAFRAEAGHHYLAVSEAALLGPEVRRVASTGLRTPAQRADWVLIAPREFLSAAQPLVDLRRSQGLLVQAVAMEDVEAEFGFGEASPQAIRDFLAYAFHHWKTRPRYVVLLGDTTYDPRDYLGTHVQDRIPSPLVATSYLWTVSDPSLAAVNGDDPIPDLAIGRLSAGTYAEAERLVGKLVAFEQAGRSFDGKAVLVADNADLAGNFEADQDEIAATVLQGRAVEKIYLRDLGAATRTTIRAALDGGPGIVSYVGHGATAVWASENVWNNTDLSTLQAQGQQPLLLTLNCLNGFFHFPPFDSLAEAFVKAEAKGALAAFSPSGLSVNEAAQLYHRALLQEIGAPQHQRLGDALLASQEAYADEGAMPELLSIYHLFGDPGMKLR